MKEEVAWVKINEVPKRRRLPGRWVKLVQELIKRKGEAVKITSVKPVSAASGIRSAAKRLNVHVRISKRENEVYAYVVEET